MKNEYKHLLRGMLKKMVKQIINSKTEANKVDSKIIEQLTKIQFKPDLDYFYNVVFENKKRPDFILKNIKNKEKYSFIIENKLRYTNLPNAKKQALGYANFLFENNLLTDHFILIITDGKSFYVSKYKIEEEIEYLEDINYIDCFEDLTKDFFSTNSSLNEEKFISLENQRNLKETFDEINNKLREYGKSSDEKLHLTMAFLFLKLISENRDLFGKTKFTKELDDNLKNLEVTPSETNIGNVFKTISKIFDNKFSFTIDDYFGDNLLIDLWTIIKQLDLDNYDLDVKGEAFEYFINYGGIKSEIGEYFTPRHIVKFIIKLLNEELKDRWLTDKKGETMTYVDPTCGTGGFLISVFKKLLQEIGDDKQLLKNIKTKSVYGVELSKRTSEIAKMNMILAGDGHINIFNESFLEYKEHNKNKYNVALGNMPFGKKIKESSFVEGFIDVVKEGGYSIFIVPSGIIGTTSKKDYIRVRERLLTEGKLLKLISLPQGVFAPYTFAKTYIIFWKKEKPISDYDIEFFDLQNDGFTLNKSRDKLRGESDIQIYFKNKNKLISEKSIFYINSKKIIDIEKNNKNILELSKITEKKLQLNEKIKLMKNQLLEINEKQQSHEKQNRISEIQNELKEISKKEKILEEENKQLNYSLKFSIHGDEEDDMSGDDFLSLEDATDSIVRGPFGSSIKKSICVSKEEGEYKIYEQSNVISENFDMGRYYLTEDRFEGLKRFEIKENDILMTCAGTLGKVALVPKNFEKGIFNSVLMRFRVNETKIIPKYLKLILESKRIQGLLVKDCIGVGIKNMIPTNELKKIKIPVPSIAEQKRIIKEMEQLSKEIKKYETKINDVLMVKEKTINYFTK